MAPRCAVIAPYAVGGGVTEAVLTSIQLLRRLGLAPLAIADQASSFADRLAAAGAECHLLPGLAAGGSFAIWRAGRRLARLIGDLRPDLVLAHNGRFIARLKRRGGPPVVGVVHGGKLDRFLAADRLITVNHDQRRELIALGYPADRVVQIDNVLPLDQLPPFTPPRRRQPPVIGTLRLLEPAKGVDLLIAACARLVAAGRDLRLEIGGTGSQMAELTAQVAALGLNDRVRFHGWVSDQAAFLGELDLYVMPSRYETFGIGIIEAQAAGLPVIASRCEGPLAVIDDQVTGLLPPPGDVEALAAAIARLLDDQALAARLAEAGYRRCAERFTLPAILPAYGAVLAAALGRPLAVGD